MSNVKYYGFGVLESDPTKFVVIGMNGPFDIESIAFHSEQELRAILKRGGSSDAEIQTVITRAKKHRVK